MRTPWGASAGSADEIGYLRNSVRLISDELYSSRGTVRDVITRLAEKINDGHEGASFPFFAPLLLRQLNLMKPMNQKILTWRKNTLSVEE